MIQKFSVIVCHGSLCHDMYLAKDGIQKQKFNINPNILPNEVYMCF